MLRDVGEQPADLLARLRELVVPELIHGVLDELDEGDEEAPRVRPVHDQTLQEHPRDLQKEDDTIHFSKTRGQWPCRTCGELKVNKQLTISKILNYPSKHVIFEHLWHYESLNDSLGFCERFTDSLESQSEF